MLSLVFILLLSAVLLPAQTLMNPSGDARKVRPIPSDLAVLEVPEPRKDLPCTVAPFQPVLGFDLRYHAGYDVSIPTNDLHSSGTILSILFRVTPQGRGEETYFFKQRVRVPKLDGASGANVVLQGMFDVGQGEYHVDWLMRDRRGLICSSYWDLKADLADRDEQIRLAIPPGGVQESDFVYFKEDPPVLRHAGDLLRVKVLLNYAPQDPQSFAMGPLDTGSLINVVRGIYRDPRIGKFSVVAFNLHEQRVLYRQMNADRIDFPALGSALESINLGTVDLARLARKHGDTEFLEELIRSETADESPPDALIFVGPKAMLDENVAREALREVGLLPFPVFYLNCNLYPQRWPWRDAVGNVVRFYKGWEYTISRPRDIWFAVKEMITKVADFKHAIHTSSSSDM